MKIYFFTGLKGGSGKTLLSVHFARYLHYVKKDRVALANFELFDELGNLSKHYKGQIPVFNFKKEPKFFLNSMIENSGEFDFLICDYSITNEFIDFEIFRISTALVVPFEYCRLDFYKTLHFHKKILDRNITVPLFFLPNKYGSHVDPGEENYFKKNHSCISSQILPCLPRSKSISSLSFTQPDINLLYQIRPVFNNLINI